ncbi:hypothetical protein OUZ56_024947 [Daphnia magna]|uniref:Secreted protein n=1 Tax=Daphnia magna TaxID=35525 RepID=A0ABQ9ZIG0_9CRUS|nr:hypothetical protein OUZ56_024947 [Daphnia magna]
MLAALMVCYMALNGGVVLRAAGFRCIEAKALSKNLTEFVITRLFSYVIVNVEDSKDVLLKFSRTVKDYFIQVVLRAVSVHGTVSTVLKKNVFFCCFPETFMTHQFRHSRRGSLYYLKKIRQCSTFVMLLIAELQ